MTFPILGGNSAVSVTGYQIDNSLRFNSGDSSSLSRTPSSAGNRAVWTWSAWVKLDGASTQNIGMFTAGGWSAGQDGTGLLYYNSQFLTYWNAPSPLSYSTGTFTDSTAWYHLVLQANTSTLKLWVNNQLQNSDSISGNGAINNTTEMAMGRYSGITNAFFYNGYMAEVHFVDGTAKAPTDFGEFDEDSGIWKPKEYDSSYGTNGFHLDFEDSSSLGNDVSGNNNDFTATNLASTDQTTDTPTNNWVVVNNLDKGQSNASYMMNLSEGNLKISGEAESSSARASGFIMSAGKWYWEVCLISAGIFQAVGIDASNSDLTTEGTGVDANSIGYYSHTGLTRRGGTATTSGSTWTTTGDIIGIAYDGDNGTLNFYKNNSLQSNNYTGLTEDFWMPSFASRNGSMVVNFGQDGSFAGNKTAQGNADGNGFGDFYYAPPSGYLALCTQNLATVNSYTIDDGSQFFNTAIWSGDGTDDRSITGVGFQPDTVWYKERNNGVSHRWVDAVRGIGKELYVDINNAEYSASNELQAYESDGFQIGSDGSINGSGDTYVGWCWKAGGTTPTQTYTVKVVSDSGNKYRFDDYGTSAVTLDLQEGGTYTFDQSDSSNSGHPLRFSTTSDGTHGSGSEYTTGVTTTGTPGSAGAKTVITVSASAPTLYYYCTQHSGMGGQANTNSTFGSSNFSGSIQSKVSANTTAGFSIVTYTGTGSDTNVGHGLGVAPKCYIIKSRTRADSWIVGHTALGTSTYPYNLILDQTGAKSGGSYDDYLTADPTSTVLNLGNAGNVNASGDTYVAYCFAEIEGYSKFGKYTGTGTRPSPYVYTGFKPAMVIYKMATTSGIWVILDAKRDPDNYVAQYLRPDSLSAEAGYNILKFTSNGFLIDIPSPDGNTNLSGEDVIYMAFASNPFVSSSGVPNTAR